jgi:hypothetical protein
MPRFDRLRSTQARRFCAVYAAGTCEEAPDERLAAAVAVDVRGVEERHPRVHRGVQDGEGVVLVDLAPVAAELPAAQPDDADLLPGPAQLPRLHVHRP